jgi:hypothetical protein
MPDQNAEPAKGKAMLPKKPPNAFGLFFFEHVDGLLNNGKPSDIVQSTKVRNSVA